MPAALIKPKHLRGVVLALVAVAPLNAEELRFDNAAQWRQWTLPLGIVELTPQGVVRPLAVRRNINAALDALDHGGGIRGVGSNRDRGLGLRRRPRDRLAARPGRPRRDGLDRGGSRSRRTGQPRLPNFRRHRMRFSTCCCPPGNRST